MGHAYKFQRVWAGSGEVQGSEGARGNVKSIEGYKIPPSRGEGWEMETGHFEAIILMLGVCKHWEVAWNRNLQTFSFYFCCQVMWAKIILSSSPRLFLSLNACTRFAPLLRALICVPASLCRASSRQPAAAKSPIGCAKKPCSGNKARMSREFFYSMPRWIR